MSRRRDLRFITLWITHHYTLKSLSTFVEKWNFSSPPREKWETFLVTVSFSLLLFAWLRRCIYEEMLKKRKEKTVCKSQHKNAQHLWLLVANLTPKHRQNAWKSQEIADTCRKFSIVHKFKRFWLLTKFVFDAITYVCSFQCYSALSFE